MGSRRLLGSLKQKFPTSPTKTTSSCSSLPPLPLPSVGFPQITADCRRSASQATDPSSPSAPIACSLGRVAAPRPLQPTPHAPAIHPPPSPGRFSPAPALGAPTLSLGFGTPAAVCPLCSSSIVRPVAPASVHAAATSVLTPGAPPAPVPVVPPAGADAATLCVRGSSRPAVRWATVQAQSTDPDPLRGPQAQSDPPSPMGPLQHAQGPPAPWAQSSNYWPSNWALFSSS